MSFINLIMEQKVILITFLLAIVPLVIGVTFLIVTSVRKRKTEQAELAQKREARRRAMATLARREAAAQREADEQEADEHAARLASTTEPRRGGRRPKPAAGSAEEPEEDDADPLLSAEAEEEAPETSESGEEESVSAEMLSLLSDVFGDDESAARYDALLKGVAEIDIDSLAALSNGIAARLRAKE